MPLIGMAKIEKKYGKQRVLRIESLSIHERDFVVITGVNGAGKSTLLRLLAGVSQPSSGKVQYAPGYTDLQVAYVPQAGGLHRHLTILENLDVSCRMRGNSMDASIIEQWYFQKLGLANQIRKPVHELSGGFQKLAAISCALGTKPDGLFLDEPFSGLDEEKSDFLFNHLFTAHQQLTCRSFPMAVKLATSFKAIAGKACLSFLYLFTNSAAKWDA